MEGIIATNHHKHGQPNHYNIQQQKQEEQYLQHLRQADNDRRSREAILRHLQPYIETERLRQQQQQVQQLQQQNRLQQQLLSQQQKRLAEELEWIQRHQQKQTAAIERQRQASLVGRQKSQTGVEEARVKDVWSQRKEEKGALVGQLLQELWEQIPSSKDQVHTSGIYKLQQQTNLSQKQQQHCETDFEQQQRQQQAELREREHREKQDLWELYKSRKQQEQETVERRQQLQQQQQQQLQQQATLPNTLQQQSPSTGGDEGYSELLKSGPPQVHVRESKANSLRPQYNRPLIPAPQNWVQSTFDTDNNKQDGIEDKHDDDEELEEDYYSGQQYHKQAQQDWRDLRRLNKAYVPLPRRKRGRKGRGDFFEDDYHAGYNKIEIQALSSAGKAAYEAQRQNRQHHDTPPPPPLPPPSALVKVDLE